MTSAEYLVTGRNIATVSMGGIVFILFCYLLVSAWSNAVNLTDELWVEVDGRLVESWPVAARGLNA